MIQLVRKCVFMKKLVVDATFRFTKFLEDFCSIKEKAGIDIEDL